MENGVHITGDAYTTDADIHMSDEEKHIDVFTVLPTLEPPEPARSMLVLKPGKRESLEQNILQFVLHNLLRRQDRKAVRHRGVCLGLHTRRGAWVTKATFGCPELLAWCHTLASEHGLAARVHVDSDQCHRSEHADKGARPVPNCIKSSTNSDVTGSWKQEKGQWMPLNPHRWHGVEPVKEGVRVSIITFVPGYLHRVRPETWNQLDDLQFPCKRLRELSTPDGGALWKLWHQPQSPRRMLYSAVVDGETVLWHDASLGLSRMLVTMGHTPYSSTAQVLNVNKLPPEIHHDTPIWLYEANGWCGFYGMDDEEMTPLNHQQCSLFQWQSGHARPSSENAVLCQCDEVDAESFPVLLQPDEELAQLEAGEAEGEDLPEEETEEADWAPSEQERNAIKHAHDNAGGARAEVVQWVSHHFTCEQCLASKRPLARLPSSVPGSSRFNAILGLDTFQLTNPQTKEQEWWLECICWGTSYSIVERVSSKAAISVWKAYSTAWRRYFSDPDVMVVDMGTEFRSPFAEMVGMTGTFLHVIDVESPWLNGRTERAHSELRHQIELMLMEVVPQNDEEWLSVVASARAARNASHNEKGFSPIQRVIGSTPRLAGELCVDGWPDAIYEGPLQAMRRSSDIRHAANRAYLKQQHRSRLRVAMRTRHRKPDVPLTPGMRVWVWRKPQRGRLPGWYGPGLILCKTTSGAYVQVSGALWKVTEQNMRPQSADDQLGWEMVKRFLNHLKHETAQERPLRKRYLDCTREPAPREVDAPTYPEEERPPDFNQEELEAEQAEQDAARQEELPVVENGENEIPVAEALDEEMLRGDIRPRPEEDQEGEEPPQRRARVEEFPYRGTTTPLPTRMTRPSSSWTGHCVGNGQQEVMDIMYQVEKGIVQVHQLPENLRPLFLQGSRLKESKAVMNTLVPMSGPEATQVLKDPDIKCDSKQVA
eukprot:5785768-Amphidinium_carterae.2